MRNGILAALVFATVLLPVTAMADKSVETPLQSAPQTFDGSQYRAAISEANAAAARRDPITAWSKLRPVLAFCDDKKNGKGKIYFSGGSKEEADSFVKSHAKETVILLDMACPAAYKSAAFLFINSNQTDSALQMLDRAHELAPFWAEALGERGYILKGNKDVRGALDAYRQALELAGTYPSSAYFKPVALRGMGFCLTDLGDLDGAEKAYRDSLAIDPSNITAKHELEYIQNLRSKGAKQP